MPRALPAALLLLAAPLAGCEGETRQETGPDGAVETEFEVGIDDDVEAGAREALSDLGEELEGAGETLRDAAGEAGAEVEDAVGDAGRALGEAGDAVGRTVDLDDDDQ